MQRRVRLAVQPCWLSSRRWWAVAAAVFLVSCTRGGRPAPVIPQSELAAPTATQTGAPADQTAKPTHPADARGEAGARGATRDTSCAAIATHYGTFLTSAGVSGTVSAPFIAALAAACTEDLWSTELRACVANANVMTDTDVCISLLSHEQHLGFDRRLKAASAREDQRAVSPATVPGSAEGGTP